MLGLCRLLQCCIIVICKTIRQICTRCNLQQAVLASARPPLDACIRLTLSPGGVDSARKPSLAKKNAHSLPRLAADATVLFCRTTLHSQCACAVMRSSSSITEYTYRVCKPAWHAVWSVDIPVYKVRTLSRLLCSDGDCRCSHERSDALKWITSPLNSTAFKISSDEFANTHLVAFNSKCFHCEK